MAKQDKGGKKGKQSFSSQKEKSSSQKLKKENENATIKDVVDIITKELPEEKLKRVIPTNLPPEEKYVRRTAEDFAAGAKPVRGSGSHRMIPHSLKLSPELSAIAKEEAERAGVSLALWIRAAMRKALREGIDVQFELEEPVEISISDELDTEPKGPK